MLHTNKLMVCLASIELTLCGSSLLLLFESFQSETKQQLELQNPKPQQQNTVPDHRSSETRLASPLSVNVGISVTLVVVSPLQRLIDCQPVVMIDRQ